MYICPWCPLTASCPEMLEEHKNFCHRFSSEDETQSDVSTSSNIQSGFTEGPHTCEQCGKTFARSWHLKRHFFIHTGERPFICVYCGEGFATGYDLKLHHRKHTGESSSPFMRCPEMSSNGELRSNMKWHTDEQPFECSLCGECFSHNCDLKAHSCTHVDERKPFICKDCGKAFSSSDILKAHQQAHANESADKKETSCEQCGESFQSKSMLIGHLRMHKVKKQLQCPLCNKVFTQSYTLKAHLRNKHTIQMMDASKSSNGCFICLHCKMEFNDALPLKSHMRAHYGEKRYKCYDCKESFKGANDLKVHVRIHTGERPFVCPECGESFTQKGNLTVHIRTHTGEKPFECQVCGRCFLKSSNLKEHMKVHEEGKQGRRRHRFLTQTEALLTVKGRNFLKETTNPKNVTEKNLVPSGGGDKDGFRDTIAERLKETGMLSFGGGKVQLQVLKN